MMLRACRCCSDAQQSAICIHAQRIGAIIYGHLQLCRGNELHGGTTPALQVGDCLEHAALGVSSGTANMLLKLSPLSLFLIYVCVFGELAFAD